MEVSMSTLFYLSSAQMDVIRPFFPRSRGIPRKDDQKIISGIIHVLKFGLRWKDAPKEYGPYKTLYNRFVRWSNMGVFEKIFTALSESTQDTSLLMIDATCLKAHRTAASLRKKGFLSLYRTHKRRIEHQITCSLWLRRTSDSDIADSRNHQWLWRCGMSLANSAFNPNTSCWQGLWCRMDSQFFEKSRLHSLHSFSEKCQESGILRQKTISPASQDRKYVFPAEGLASHSHALWLLCSHIPFSNSPCGYRYFLPLMSPEPR